MADGDPPSPYNQRTVRVTYVEGTDEHTAELQPDRAMVFYDADGQRTGMEYDRPWAEALYEQFASLLSSRPGKGVAGHCDSIEVVRVTRYDDDGQAVDRGTWPAGNIPPALDELVEALDEDDRIADKLEREPQPA